MRPDRYSRQKDVVPADRLGRCSITIIGVGAVGRQLALQLASMGAIRLQLVDFDRVEDSNVASQGYAEADLGQPKVTATAEACQRVNSNIIIDAIDGRFRRSMDVGDVVFAAVDSIETRRIIWEAVGPRVAFFADARVTAETIRILAVGDLASAEHYPRTLFPSAEAHAGSCTSKMTVYAGAIAAGMLLSQFTRWLRGLPADADISLNLLASELAVL